MHEKKQYNHVVDFLRVLAILAVVMIHTTTRTMQVTHFDLARISWTFFLNQVSRFAVPLFFMISGFVLELNFHLNESYLTYLKKRLSRIVIPYILWTTLYHFFVFRYPLKDYWSALLYGTGSYQLYFIPALLVFYLIFPLIHKHYHVLSRKVPLLILGVVQFALLSYDYYIHGLPFVKPITIFFLNFYIFFLGAVAVHQKEKLFALSKQWRILLYAATILVTVFVLFEGKFLYGVTHNYLSYYSQWRPSIVLYTVLLAYSLYYFFSKKSGASPVIKKLAHLSFFVYFIHVLILELLWRWYFAALFTHTKRHVSETFWFDPIFFILVAAISFALGYLCHKIPKLSRIVG